MRRDAIYKKIIMCVLVLVEISIIGFLTYLLIIRINMRNNVLGTSYVGVLKKEDLQFVTVSNLKYYYEYSPSQSVPVRPDWALEDAVYTINKDTLNERYEYSLDTPPDTYRILTMGDSWTFGQYVNTGDNWPEKLEDMLNEKLPSCKKYKRYEVINQGQIGYDIQYSIARYIHRGLKYKPDFIIWMVENNDFTMPNEIETPIENECNATLSDAERQDALLKGIHYPCGDYFLKVTHDRQDEFISQQFSLYKDFLSGMPEKVLVVTPNWTEDKFLKIMKDGVPDSRNRFRILPAVDLFPDFHPSPKGHEQLASAIYDLFVRNMLVCR